MIGGLTLVALIVAAATSDRTGRLGATLVGLLSLVWFLVNGEMEGPVLWTFSSDHGLTAGDLAGVAGLGVAGWRFLFPTHR